MAKAAAIIVLFRNDLRISDNKALAVAADTGRPIVPLFILDDSGTGVRLAGAARKWWLHHSLAELDKSLARLGSGLVLRKGVTEGIVADALKATNADTVFWNRRYAPADIAIDKALKAGLRADGLEAESFDGFLLHEPSRVVTQSGEFYKVFTPFYKRLATNDEPRDPVDAPRSLSQWTGKLHSEGLEAFRLLPRKPDWSGGLAERWQPGEKGARERLEDFLEQRLDGYAGNRDLPAEDGTSGLSPHLAHGEITPFEIMAAMRRKRSRDAETFRKELAWREFSYHLLFHRPDLHRHSFRPEFEAFRGGAPRLR